MSLNSTDAGWNTHQWQGLKTQSHCFSLLKMLHVVLEQGTMVDNTTECHKETWDVETKVIPDDNRVHGNVQGGREIERKDMAKAATNTQQYQDDRGKYVSQRNPVAVVFNNYIAGSMASPRTTGPPPKVSCSCDQLVASGAQLLCRMWKCVVAVKCTEYPSSQ